MLPKVLQFDEHFERTGEARCQIIDPRDRALYKYASSDTLDYCSTIDSVDGRTIVLVLAMSASEYYGPNRNGDAFSEKPVKINGEWAVAPGETLPEHHKTFEQHAHAYRHHINKDPKKSFGEVMKSFYNWKMHRVELLLSLDNAKAMDIVGRIDGGEYPAVSMGCRIKYDVCNRCGNRAPTRKQYCEHVNGTNPEFGMNRLDSDGFRDFVWNPAPHLFDISFVFKPADRIGYTMKKVAEPYALTSSAALGERVHDLAEKRAILQKVSDIDKIITGEMVDPTKDSVTMSQDEYNHTRHLLRAMNGWLCGTPTISHGQMTSVSHLSAPDMFSSFNALGMAPTTVEIFRFMTAQNGLPSDSEVEKRLAMSQGKVASVMAEMPHLYRRLEDAGLFKISAEHVRPEMLKLAAPMREKRALYKDYLARNYIPESVGPVVDRTGIMNILPGEDMSATQAYYTPTHQVLDWRDPKSGRTYQTTRRAAERADWENRKKELVELAGLSAVLGGGYKVLSSKYPWLAAPAALGALGGGYTLMKNQQTDSLDTEQGIKVPVNTEFIEKRSSVPLEVVVPLAGGALLTGLLAQDYGAVAPGRAVHAAQTSPFLTTIGTSGAIGGTGALLNQLRTQAAKMASHNPVSYDEVDLSSLCHKLGQALLS